MTNNKWCNSKDIKTLSRSCSPNLEHLTISCHPYLPREFSTVIITAIYIPPLAGYVALLDLHDVLCRPQTQHRDMAVVVGDFHRAILNKVMPNFHQHITCATRGEITFDQCYTPFKRGYKAASLPSLGKSNHAAIFLLPE